MNRADVIDRLKAVEPQLRAHGVGALYLFGSCARDDAREDSDIDVFVDPADVKAFGLNELIGANDILQNNVAERLGRHIDFGTRAGLDKYIKAKAEKEAVRVF